jgi:hypothetical protein
LLNYSGLLGLGSGESGKFFPGLFSPFGTAGFGEVFKNWSGFFCGLGGPFFLPQKKQKNQKSSGARGG